MRPEQTGKQERRLAQPATAIEAANTLMEALPWDLLESSHAGWARKQILDAIRKIFPKLDAHNVAMKVLEHELDYKTDVLIELSRKAGQPPLRIAVLTNDIEFLKTLLEEE